MAVPNLQFASISTAASGDTTIVAGATGKVIKVYGYVLVGGGTVAAKFKSGAGTDLTGAMSLLAGSVISVAGSEVPAFATSAGQALVINLGGAIQVSGHIAYTVEG